MAKGPRRAAQGAARRAGGTFVGNRTIAGVGRLRAPRGGLRTQVAQARSNRRRAAQRARAARAGR